ncbi:hypothetical protein [Amycolatopsis australiensis]|uniref:hypothetical protein n=1 Tax=Amycolatopsis australiensis TaxID=546364 RepID=UPI0009313B38|nr:hypothetical protein [Amycolatopsis australiensis]
MAFTVDSRTLVTTKADNGFCVVRTWEAAAGRPTGQNTLSLALDGNRRNEAKEAALSADGRIVAVTPVPESAEDIGVHLRDVGGGRIGSAGMTEDKGPGAKPSPDGRLLVTASAPHDDFEPITVPYAVAAVTFSPDGHTLTAEGGAVGCGTPERRADRRGQPRNGRRAGLQPGRPDPRRPE